MIFYPGLQLSHSILLILAAAVPAFFLMVKVYKSDKLEPESPALLRSLVIAGVLSSLLALVEEIVLEYALGIFVSNESFLYNIRFDGKVYAVFVSLGFALWENISYVLSYGMSTALVRAFTAVPGHACFGVFMGVFYSIAKEQDLNNKKRASSFYRKLALIVPVLLHGSYDYIATMDGTTATIVFIVFVTVMFLVAYRLINNLAKTDRHMTWRILN